MSIIFHFKSEIFKATATKEKKTKAPEQNFPLPIQTGDIFI